MADDGQGTHPLLMTISLAEWLKAKTAYTTLRIALTEIAHEPPRSLLEARIIADRALDATAETL
jgi:hypothetical protein